MTLQPQARALGDPTRHDLYRHLVAAARPLGVTELAEVVDVSVNAVRQHLVKLVNAGLVTERRAAPAGPGRPRIVYEADPVAAGAWGGPGPYERLTGLLLDVIHSGRTPEEVGRAAADSFRVPVPTGDVVADLEASMARQGFAPETRPRRSGAEMVLHACPFASISGADREVVCGLHLGIADGLVDGPDLALREVVAHPPRQAGCRFRLGPRATDAEPTDQPELILR